MGCNYVSRETIFWISLFLMAAGFVLPGLGVIGAQILLLRNG